MQQTTRWIHLHAMLTSPLTEPMHKDYLDIPCPALVRASRLQRWSIAVSEA